MKKKVISKNKFPHNWQWKSSASGYQLLILLALAQFGKRNSDKVFYTGTATDLSQITGLTPRTAQRALKALMDKGVVQKASDNMSLSNYTFSVQPATICRSVSKASDNMSLTVFSPNDININNINNINTISNPLNIYAWAKKFNNFSFNQSGKLTERNLKFIKNNFQNVNIEIEIEKFIDYWSSKNKPNTWSGYRRLLTWLQKAGRNENEKFKTRRFSKGKDSTVSKIIDEETKNFAERQRAKRAKA